MLRLLRPILAALVLCAASAPPPDALAQAAAPAGSPQAQAQAARDAATKALGDIGAGLQQLTRDSAQSEDDAQLATLRTQALALQTQAEAVADDLAPRLTTLDGYLAQLGPAPAPASAEPPTVRQMRSAMTKAQVATDGLLKQARLLSTATSQAAEHIAERRRTLFNQRLLTRAPSPFSPDLWSDIASNLPRDAVRLQRLAQQAAVTATRNFGPRSLALLAAAIAVAALMVGPARLWLESVGRRRATGEAPGSRLRRSGLAMWLLAVGSLAPALGAVALRLGLDWSGLLSSQAGELADSATAMIIWMAFVTAVGRAFLSVKRGSWRLPRMSDALAARLRPYPWLVALVTASGAMLERLNSVIGASLAATVAANCAISLAYAATAGLGLAIIGRERIHERGNAAERDAAGSPVRSLITLAILLAVAAAFAAALLGYFALAYLIARQILWVGVLAPLLYLSLAFVDDVFTAVLSADSRLGRQLRGALGLRASTLDQLGELGSALLRVLLVLAALGLVLSPFGAGAGDVAGRFGALATGFKLGGIAVSPLGLAGGVLSFAVGVWAVRATQRWLNDRYLPKTDWDSGVRASVSTAVGYLGVLLAAIWALASMGLGLQRIALIASALSVGIGFGLQAIVSNFISGLILLLERPVKVGDWVAVGELEGDVKRINVRATEIAMFDRSTLIVPNSEFVTKTVRNVTHGDSMGRVTVRMGVALDSDVEKARAVILDACREAEAVLDDPEPKVFLDAVTETGLTLQCFAYVASPRQAYPTRSALYFDILRRLRQAGVALAQSRTDVRVDIGGAERGTPLP